MVKESGEEKKEQRATCGIAMGEKRQPAESQHKASHRQHKAEKTYAMQEIGMEKERSRGPDQRGNVNQNQQNPERLSGEPKEQCFMSEIT